MDVDCGAIVIDPDWSGRPLTLGESQQLYMLLGHCLADLHDQEKERVEQAREDLS